ncbi:hypothetical protein DY000_02043958 [Brassica cretica]|uniref:Uncharacterized protein n=1 Tax=Brassica cretica TaxID=69181 RepID=A0ABQ7BA13_BRACR|nr:hypothetical protein DY000_02043958 [Brassica cretica]
MHEYLSYLAEKRLLESYLEKVEAKRQEFTEFANYFKRDSDTPKPKSIIIGKFLGNGKKFKVALLFYLEKVEAKRQEFTEFANYFKRDSDTPKPKKKAHREKNSRSPFFLEIEEEAVPKNAPTMSS